MVPLRTGGSLRLYSGAFMNFKKISEKYEKGLDTLASFERFFGMLAMAFIILLNVYGISSRYFLNRPIMYIHELTILVAVWLFFIGMGLVFKAHSELHVEFLVRHFPKRLRLINDLFVDVMIFFFVVVLAWKTWKFIPFTRTEVPVLSFALGLRDEIYFYPIGLGAISIFLTVFHRFLCHLAQFRSNWKSTVVRGKEEN
jgi:TRAP-type C4-dicarboxylate transport system permease small subunit